MIKTKIFWIFTLIITFYLKSVKADDDDLLLDFASGLVIGLCETSEACAPILPWIFTICFIVLIFVCIFGDDEDRRGLIPSGNQLFASGGGYWTGRMLGR